MNGAPTILSIFGSNQDHLTLRNWLKYRENLPVTDLLFSVLAEWNIILRQAGWIVPALIQITILN
jgi:hypothetical protein